MFGDTKLGRFLPKKERIQRTFCYKIFEWNYAKPTKFEPIFLHELFHEWVLYKIISTRNFLFLKYKTELGFALKCLKKTRFATKSPNLMLLSLSINCIAKSIKIYISLFIFSQSSVVYPSLKLHNQYCHNKQSWKAVSSWFIPFRYALYLFLLRI